MIVPLRGLRDRTKDVVISVLGTADDGVCRRVLHPGLSLVAYTLLAQGDVTPEARAADLAAHFGLDKSTVSRQLEQLISAGLLRREGERPGRRGCQLALTTAGQQHLATAAQAVQRRLEQWLTDWDDRDIVAFGVLVSRFNQSTSRTYLAG